MKMYVQKSGKIPRVQGGTEIQFELKQYRYNFLSDS